MNKIRLSTSVKLCTLLMAAYAASLLLGSLKVAPNTSLPFFIASVYLVAKLYRLCTTSQPKRFTPEIWLIVGLNAYLILSELFIHDGSFWEKYYISLSLNCLMLLVMIEEFDFNRNSRNLAMRVYLLMAVFVSLLVILNIMTTSSYTGRLTFMDQNQNELAAALLIAYCGISLEYEKKGFPIIQRLLICVGSFVILDAIVSTGTRFAMGGVLAVLALLLWNSLIKLRNINWNSIVYVLVSFLYFLLKVRSFTPAAERLVPANVGNNLLDVGGRLPLWHYAIDAFKEAPFFGLGYAGYQRFVLEHERFFELPHNFLVEVAALGGIFGIMILIAICVICCWRILRNLDWAARIENLIWAVPVVVMLLMVNVAYMKVYWFVLAYLLTQNLTCKKAYN